MVVAGTVEGGGGRSWDGGWSGRLRLGGRSARLLHQLCKRGLMWEWWAQLAAWARSTPTPTNTCCCVLGCRDSSCGVQELLL